ncbi:TIGR04282 family arsenosugar biosynthesis glycosyltransferase [Algibacter miyuki]|uniref:TIGR04282 family arsenosugar biosynthesis glycosyltransferase n=1 Tax=Algibacter miyuki TaxID=1306933 RepID=A0ABV5H197_9FLAO|nr:TIGR04282 family arsenosugar biosynthesis glycosyltransferase [Algibacter miyuki]MDN3666282.1 TIGR04282 family arsenosugar biosynthesis glycosyltransferase [Algibacter miyuki]
MNKNLIIVFVKNIALGKVKTRLAKTIGNQGAFDVYSELVKVTQTAVQNTKTDKHIYFSETVESNTWESYFKTTQNGEDLGQRMKNAFIDGFNKGYERIVLIGSDLPDIDAIHLESGLKALQTNNVVFGPALDGGYYLVGLSKLNTAIFDNKPWSQPNLLDTTLQELDENNVSYTLLEPLNDIDTFEDLKASAFYKNNTNLQQRIQQLQ